MRYLPDIFWIAESRCTGKARWYKTEIELFKEIEHNDNSECVVKYEAYQKLKSDLAKANARIEEQARAITDADKLLEKGRLLLSDNAAMLRRKDQIIKSLNAKLKRFDPHFKELAEGE